MAAIVMEIDVPPAEKNAISHRGRAARALATHLGVEAKP